KSTHRATSWILVRSKPNSHECARNSLKECFLSGSRICARRVRVRQCSGEPAHTHPDSRHGHCRGRSPTKPAQPPNDDEFLHYLPLGSDDHHHAHNRNSHHTIDHSAPISRSARINAGKRHTHSKRCRGAQY